MKSKSFLLTALMAILAFGNSFAQRFQVGELEFEIISDEDKTVSLIGGDRSTIKELIIPETVSYNNEVYTVTTIKADFYHSELIAVTIPNSVTSIKDFSMCMSLQFVNIGNSVETISNGAFMGSPAYFFVDPDNPYFSSENGVLYNKDKTLLVSCQTADKDGAVNIPETVEKLAPQSFHSNLLLKQVTISPAVTEIGYNAFGDCTSLKTVLCLPAVPPGYLGLTDTGAWVSQLTCDVYVPDSSVEIYENEWGRSYQIFPMKYYPVTSIGYIDNIEYAILSENDKSVAITDYEYRTGDSLEVPEQINYSGETYTVEMIGREAFLNCGKEEIILPSTINMISGYAFTRSSTLNKILLPAEEPPMLSPYAFWKSEVSSNHIPVTIYVPDSSVSHYKATNWGELNIKPISSYADSNNIETIREELIFPVDVFSLDGRFIRSLKNKEEISNLKKGLYIIGGKKVIVNH